MEGWRANWRTPAEPDDVQATEESRSRPLSGPQHSSIVTPTGNVTERARSVLQAACEAASDLPAGSMVEVHFTTYHTELGYTEMRQKCEDLAAEDDQPVRLCAWYLHKLIVQKI